MKPIKSKISKQFANKARFERGGLRAVNVGPIRGAMGIAPTYNPDYKSTPRADTSRPVASTRDLGGLRQGNFQQGSPGVWSESFGPGEVEKINEGIRARAATASPGAMSALPGGIIKTTGAGGAVEYSNTAPAPAPRATTWAEGDAIDRGDPARAPGAPIYGPLSTGRQPAANSNTAALRGGVTMPVSAWNALPGAAAMPTSPRPAPAPVTTLGSSAPAPASTPMPRTYPLPSVEPAPSIAPPPPRINIGSVDWMSDEVQRAASGALGNDLLASSRLPVSTIGIRGAAGISPKVEMLEASPLKRQHAQAAPALTGVQATGKLPVTTGRPVVVQPGPHIKPQAGFVRGAKGIKPGAYIPGKFKGDNIHAVIGEGERVVSEAGEEALRSLMGGKEAVDAFFTDANGGVPPAQSREGLHAATGSTPRPPQWEEIELAKKQVAEARIPGTPEPPPPPRVPVQGGTVSSPEAAAKLAEIKAQGAHNAKWSELSSRVNAEAGAKTGVPLREFVPPPQPAAPAAPAVVGPQPLVTESSGLRARPFAGAPGQPPIHEFAGPTQPAAAPQPAAPAEPMVSNTEMPKPGEGPAPQKKTGLAGAKETLKNTATKIRDWTYSKAGGTPAAGTTVADTAKEAAKSTVRSRLTDVVPNVVKGVDKLGAGVKGVVKGVRDMTPRGAGRLFAGLEAVDEAAKVARVSQDGSLADIGQQAATGVSRMAATGAGAAMGTAVLPVVGTALGGLAGYYGGDALLKHIQGRLGQEQGDPFERVVKAEEDRKAKGFRDQFNNVTSGSSTTPPPVQPAAQPAAAASAPATVEETPTQRATRQLAALRGLRGGSSRDYENSERSPYRYSPSQDTLETEARNTRITEQQALDGAITRARQLHPRGLATPKMISTLTEGLRQGQRLSSEERRAAAHDAVLAEGNQLRHQADIYGVDSRSSDAAAQNEANIDRERIQQEGGILRERLQQEGGVVRAEIQGAAQIKARQMGLNVEQFNKRGETNRTALQSMIGDRKEDGTLVPNGAEYAKFEQRLVNSLGKGTDLNTFMSLLDAPTIGYLIDLNSRAKTQDKFADGVLGTLARLVGSGAASSTNLSDYAYSPQSEDGFFFDRTAPGMQLTTPYAAGARTMTGVSDAQRARYIDREKRGLGAGQ